MADQDGLVQMGSEIMLEDSVAQDTFFQGDLSLQPYPEVTLGATMTATMLGHPLHQISPTEDRTIPIGSTLDHSKSALPKPFGMDQIMEIMKRMMERMDLGENRMKREMQNMGINLQTQMNGNLQNM